MGDCSSAVDSTISFLKKISSRMFFAWSFSCTIGFFSRRLLFAFTIASLFQHLLIVGCLLPCRTKWLPRRFAPMKESIDYEDSIIFFTQNTPFFFFFLAWIPVFLSRMGVDTWRWDRDLHPIDIFWIFQFGILPSMMPDCSWSTDLLFCRSS